MAFSEVDTTDRFVEYNPASTGNVTKSTGTASGDLAIIAVSWYENSVPQTINTPSGFTSQGSLVIGGTAPDRSLLTIFTRLCDGSEGASYTVSFSGNVFANAVLITLRSSLGAITFASATAGTAATGTTSTAPSVSGTSGQALVCPFGYSDPTTLSTPAGMTVGPTGGTSTNGATWFWETLVATGATGTRVSTLGTSRDNGAWSILLNEPAPVTTTQTQPPANIRHSEGGKRRNWDKTGWFNTRAAKNDWFWRGWPVTAGTSPDVTVALTGQSISTATGTVKAVIDKALSGQSTAFALGTTTPAISKALTGQSAAFATGTITVVYDKALSGQSAAFSAGTLTPNIDKALIGQVATFSTGTITYSVSADVTVALTGQSISTAQGTLVPAIDKALSGQSTALSQGSVTPASAKALSGQVITSSQGTISPSTSVPLIGLNAVFAQGTLTYVLAGDVTVALTGQSMELAQGALVFTPEEQASIRRRRKTRRLLVVRFDDQEIGIESAQELKQLARLSDSLPVVTLLPNVDYGSKIAALQKAAEQINRERERILDQEDEEFLMLVA